MSNSTKWTPVAEKLPGDRRDVIAGHSLGQWVREDVRFIDGVFRVRHNAQRGGDAGFRQVEEAKAMRELGMKLPPEAPLWSAEIKPTHWMYLPTPPEP